MFGQTLEREGSSAQALYGAGLASEDLGRKGQALDDCRRLPAIPTQADPEARASTLSASPASSADAEPLRVRPHAEGAVGLSSRARGP